MLTIFLLMSFILIVAMIYEMKTYLIHPFIWIVGGILGLACNVIGLGIVSWLEGVITAIILLIILLLCFSQLNNFIGGGVLKGFITIGLLLGRYSLLAIINFIAVCIIYNIFRKKDSISGRGQVSGSLILLISIVFTCGEYFLITQAFHTV